MLKENNSLAIFYIIAGMTVFSVQDTLVRILSSEVSILQIMFLRSVVGLSILFLYLKVRKIPIIFSSQYPLLTVIRAILFMFAFLFYYVGLAYYGRTYKEGKKIGWRDGLRAIWCILKYNIFN